MLLELPEAMIVLPLGHKCSCLFDLVHTYGFYKIDTKDSNHRCRLGITVELAGSGSCFHERIQTSEIRLPYHLNTIRALLSSI